MTAAPHWTGALAVSAFGWGCYKTRMSPALDCKLAVGRAPESPRLPQRLAKSLQISRERDKGNMGKRCADGKRVSSPESAEDLFPLESPPAGSASGDRAGGGAWLQGRGLVRTPPRSVCECAPQAQDALSPDPELPAGSSAGRRVRERAPRCAPCSASCWSSSAAPSPCTCCRRDCPAGGPWVPARTPQTGAWRGPRIGSEEGSQVRGGGPRRGSGGVGGSVPGAEESGAGGRLRTGGRGLGSQPRPSGVGRAGWMGLGAPAEGAGCAVCGSGARSVALLPGR